MLWLSPMLDLDVCDDISKVTLDGDRKQFISLWNGDTPKGSIHAEMLDGDAEELIHALNQARAHYGYAALTHSAPD